MQENLKNKILTFLSGKTISVLIVMLAICSRILQLFFFFNIRVDGMYQYLAMKYFVYGHGVSIAEVLPTDLSQPIYEPLINWPPGYSILLSPFYILFNHNYVAAGLALDILAATALIIFTRKTLRLLDVPTHLINIYTIFSGFFIYNFYFIASSDAIAISLFVIAFYLTLKLIITSANWLLNTILISLLLICCGFIKYLFYPVVFVIPIFLIIKGLLDKEVTIKKAGICSFLLIGFCLGALLLYQKTISGTAAYISQPQRGFFPENLSLAYPFIPGSIINPESITRVLSSLKNSETFIFRIFQLIHIVSIIAISIGAVLWIKKKRLLNLTIKNSFFILTLSFAIVITGLLAVLSFSVAKEEINPGVFWSYIEDARYYGLITVLFQMSLFITINQLWVSNIKRWKFITPIIFLLLLPETLRGIIFDANRITKINKEKYSWQSELRVQQFIEKIIASKKKTLNFNKTVITGNSYYYNYRTCIYSNAYYLNELHDLEDISQLNTKEDILFLFLSTKKRDTEELNFEGSIMNLNIYSKLINKN